MTLVNNKVFKVDIVGFTFMVKYRVAKVIWPNSYVLFSCYPMVGILIEMEFLKNKTEITQCMNTYIYIFNLNLDKFCFNSEIERRQSNLIKFILSFLIS